MKRDLVKKRDYIEARGNTSSLFLQNVFFQGNGEIGLRCVLPGDDYKVWNHGMFRAGVFEYIKKGITDMVNLPDPICARISVDGIPLGSGAEYVQRLYFDSGKVERILSCRGRKIKVERIISFSEPSLVSMRITFSPSSGIDVETFFDDSVMNMPVNDDQSISDEDLIALYKTGGESGDTLSVSTLSGMFSFTYHIFRKKTEDKNAVSHEATVSLDSFREDSFSDIEEDNIRHLSQFWSHNDILIDGPEEDQCALRYNILMLHMNAPRKDVSIGARGLAHPRYKGCYFWDSEVFLLPYFFLTDMDAARHMIKYRLDNIESAKKNAALHNNSGARFPWMCSLDGSEQCESWDTGKCEIHVTADVAWAVDRYISESGDKSMLDKAADLYLETARFWLSRFSYEKKTDSYRLLFVKGPDEYCGVTHNNTYTALMAAHNIRLALSAEEKGLLEIGEEEKARFNSLLEKMEIPYSEEYGTYLEDETFVYLEDVDIDALKEGGEPLYRKFSFDRLQRMKILKQPDVILLFLTLPQVFTGEKAMNAWNLYEPITAHDSTLSWGMHSLAAYRLGLKDKGEEYFLKTLHLDLSDNMDNTEAEGIHIGAMGSALQSVLTGMLDTENGKSLLPQAWKSLETTLLIKGRRMKIRAEGGALTAEPL
ncbi:MAG: hypothetical protein ACI4S4_07005 [Candidatus Ornithospirochaeta sp.]